MPRWKTTSSEDKAKVIEAKLNNPDLSTRDIEKQTWVEHTTTSRILKNDMQQIATQSETITKLIDDNNKILNITWIKLLEKLADEEWKIRLDELTKARDLAFRQNELTKAMENPDKEVKVTFEL